MKAVVTGGAGFIGSHLIERLLARGDEVICIERRGANQKWIENLDVDFRDCGLAREADLADALRGADAVFHLAGLTQARRSDEYYAVNADGTEMVLRVAADMDIPPRVVLASSIAAVGPCRNGEALTLHSVPHPLSHYGNSKLIAEAVVHAYEPYVPAVILRLPTIYGPRELALFKLFQMVSHGFALTVGPWDRQASLLFVADLVEGLVRASTEKSAAGQTLYLTHPKPVTWRALAKAIGRELHRRPKLVSIPKPIAKGVAIGAELGAWVSRSAAVLNRDRVREITQDRWVCDASSTFRKLHFQPEYPLERGVRVTANWYREQGWL